MIAALIHLIVFTMFVFFCILGVLVFLVVNHVKKNPTSSVYWIGLVRRILDL